MKRINTTISSTIAELLESCERLPGSADRVAILVDALAASHQPGAAFALLPLLWPCVRPRQSHWIWLPRELLWESVQFDVPSSVRVAARRAIQRLIRSIKPQFVPAFDQLVRRFGPNRWAIFFGGKTYMWVEPPSPAALPADAERASLLCLLSSHADGRVREAAVAELARSPDTEALAFLLWRSVDWVVQVRQRAEDAVRAALRAEHARAFAALLPLISRFEKIGRVDASALVRDVRNFLSTPPGHAAVVDSLASGDTALRRDACRQLDKDVAAPAPETIDRVAGDADLVVRQWAIRWEPRLRPRRSAEAARMRARLLNDPVPGIRVGALRAVVEAGSPDEAAHPLRAALLDGSPSMRETARFHLRTLDPQLVPAALYRNVLQTQSGRPVRLLAAAASGLGETGDRDDFALLQSLLGGPARLARAALRAMAWLDPGTAHETLLASVGDARDGVCRAALLLLPKHLPADDGPRLEKAWTTATTPTAAKAMAAATLKLPPWVALGILLRLVAEAPAQSEAAVDALARWHPEHRAFYAPIPPSDQLGAALRHHLAAAYSILGTELAGRIGAALTR